MIAAGDFLEWAGVYGHRKGTPRGPVEAELAGGRDVLLEIDVQGAANVLRRAPRRPVLVFLRPPSAEELRRRLEGRRSDPPGDLEVRERASPGELAEAGWFDHVVTNDRVDRAARQIARIIEPGRGDSTVPGEDPEES